MKELKNGTKMELKTKRRTGEKVKNAGLCGDFWVPFSGAEVLVVARTVLSTPNLPLSGRERHLPFFNNELSLLRSVREKKGTKRS